MVDYELPLPGQPTVRKENLADGEMRSNCIKWFSDAHMQSASKQIQTPFFQFSVEVAGHVFSLSQLEDRRLLRLLKSFFPFEAMLGSIV